MIQIRSQGELDIALATSTFVLFIHSLLCETSLAVFREFEQWSSGNPGTENGWIDADADSLLARTASDRIGLPSRSPQAVFLRRGRPAWTAVGPAITQASLRSAFGWPLLARG